MNQYNNCPKALFCDTKPICENDFPNKKMWISILLTFNKDTINTKTKNKR
jgi:hypothetical protein